MNRKFNVGIIGAGRIAKKFAEGILRVDEANLYAIASRDVERAEEFAKAYGADKVYGNYEEMLQDEQLDLVYISTPNALHKEHALLCIKHHKNIICEKPFTSNARELEEVISAAKAQDVFLMEAMWTRYLPVITEVRKLIEDGKIGKIQHIEASFCFAAADRKSIKFDRALAGGALMDVGIYPISLASMVLKEQPKNIKAVAYIGESGIDERTSMIFEYAEGTQAVLDCAITMEKSKRACIVGEKGFIELPLLWFATQAVVKIEGQEAYEIIDQEQENGYQFELKEAIRCIRAGEKESKWMKLEESLEIMRTLDKVRKEIGLEFPVD